MDFFAVQPKQDGLHNNFSTESFAAALARRDAQTNFNLSLPTLTPTQRTTFTRDLPSSISFPPITPANLQPLLDNQHTLVLDIRPHAAYSAARISSAVSLSVPSTLLKRPAFSLERLTAMLPSKHARRRFSAWRSADRIIVYDADGHAIPEHSNILGLLRKLKNDGFQGDLFWLKGGFQCAWRENRDIIDTRPPTPDDIEDEDDNNNNAAAASSPDSSVLRTGRLPLQAFTLSSTLMHQGPSTQSSMSTFPPNQMSQSRLTPAPSQAANPFYDTIRQNVELSHGVTERIPLLLPRRVRRRINDLPTPWLKRIAQHAGKSTANPHPACSNSSEDETDDDAHPDQSDVDNYAEALAMQFYRIEREEQRRLMGIMEHHSKESGAIQEDGAAPVGVPFPFSITAGVEKGAKNRYRHIWPFEHARVKLNQKDDDYVNASYVQALGSSKRYIATQGPLPATFTDFWTLCWEQNVHVIVMLTREVEGAQVKCGSYWTGDTFGPLRLRLVSTSGAVDSSQEPSGFFSAYSSFDPRSSRPSYPQGNSSSTGANKHRHYHKSETIKRVFELTHTGFPDVKPRRIIHLQYLEWPDMNVPDDPRGLLGLVKQVEEARVEAGLVQPADPDLRGLNLNALDMDPISGISKNSSGANSPLLLHCSAGVGRTGGFIAIDAILDSIRMQVRHGQTTLDDRKLLVDSQSMVFASSAPSKMPTDEMLVDDRIPCPPAFDFGRSSDVSMQMDNDNGPKGNTEMSEANVLSMDHLSRTHTIPSFSTTRRWAERVGAETDLQPTRPHSLSSLMKVDRASTSSIAETIRPAPSTTVLETSSPAFSSGDRTLCENDVSNGVVSLRTSTTFNTTTHEGICPPMPIDTFFSVTPKERTSSALVHNTAASINGKKVPLSTIRRPAPPGLSLNLISPSPSSAPFLSSERTTKLCANFGSAPGIFPPHSATGSVSLDSHSQTNSTQPGFTKTFDYKDPRPTHAGHSPISLEAYDEPIFEVIQDMREQRMSLCQSLRQYVFVHVAIIEGALMVVDEEKALAEANLGRDAGIGERGVRFLANSTVTSTKRPKDGSQSKAAPLKTAPGYLASQKHSHSRASSSTRSPSITQMMQQDTSGSRPSSPSHAANRSQAGQASFALLPIHRTVSSESGYRSCASTNGKRSASPTELVKEGREGDLLQSKRPSMKRKSSDRQHQARGSGEAPSHHCGDGF